MVNKLTPCRNGVLLVNKMIMTIPLAHQYAKNAMRQWIHVSRGKSSPSSSFGSCLGRCNVRNTSIAITHNKLGTIVARVNAAERAAPVLYVLWPRFSFKTIFMVDGVSK